MFCNYTDNVFIFAAIGGWTNLCHLGHKHIFNLGHSNIFPLRPSSPINPKGPSKINIEKIIAKLALTF